LPTYPYSLFGDCHMGDSYLKSSPCVVASFMFQDLHQLHQALQFL